MYKKILFGLLFLCLNVNSQNFKNTITNYLNENSSSLSFERSDASNFIVSNSSYSESLKAYNVYIQQAYLDVPIHNAIGSVAIKNNKVVSFKHSFIADINQKISFTSASITAEEAVIQALNALEIEVNNPLATLELVQDYDYIFQSAEISNEVIPVKLMYVLGNDSTLKLAWDFSLLTKTENHWWSISVDAQTGDIIRKNDWMLTCHFNSDEDKIYTTKTINYQEDFLLSTPNDGSVYRAFALGVESPNHGIRSLLSEPAHPVASPFGWHDINGVSGAEFTTTRGNNVLASEDRDADNFPGYSPDGGANLMFDFPIDNNLPPASNEDAAITNLFVWNNLSHDLLFTHGFDEAAGNFQQTNYSGSGFGNDFVLADAQDGGGFNNANFGTPPDGLNPRMQMFLWSPPNPPVDLLTVNSPSDIATSYLAVQAGFGPRLTPTPITADLALIEDDNFTPDSNDTHDACDLITNGASLSGKIVVIRRGSCTFVQKVLAAQNNGAIAVIMVNNVPGNPIVMGGNNNTISIPSVMIGDVSGNTIITKLQNGESINATLVNNGPFETDSDYDNGIIAHEYGHGLSNRLTGGAAQVNCLFNDEQMGEGWSDYLSLMMTLNVGDIPETPRGVGTFAVSQPTNGNGIRPLPYSTDFNVNFATYGFTNNENSISQPHGIGFVWATMLWDLTWELINIYGFDPDLVNGTGGNNLALQLVIDGMKLQNCNPGFIDGRDAIIQADQIANNGANVCFIWKAFANRGLGFSATQGSSFERDDQTEAFDLPPNIVLPCQVLSTNAFIENNIHIYPVPSNEYITIENKSTLQLGVSSVKIYDLNGKLVHQSTLDLNTTKDINISHFGSGIFVLKIENSQVNLTKKIIVN